MKEQGRFSSIRMELFATIRNNSISKLTEAAHVTGCSEMLFSNYQKEYKAAENLTKYLPLKKPKVNEKYPANQLIFKKTLPFSHGTKNEVFH